MVPNATSASGWRTSSTPTTPSSTCSTSSGRRASGRSSAPARASGGCPTVGRPRRTTSTTCTSRSTDRRTSDLRGLPCGELAPRAGRPVELQPGVLVPAEQEQRQLAGAPLTTAGSSPLRSTAVRSPSSPGQQISTGTPAERTSPLPATLIDFQIARCSRSVSSRGSQSGRGPADVLVVHEVLEGVERPVQRGKRHRRPARRTAAHPLDQRGEVLRGQPARRPVGEPLQLGDHDARRAERVALADEQVDDEVLDGPACRTASVPARRPRARCCTTRHAPCATSTPCGDPRADVPATAPPVTNRMRNVRGPT